MTPAIGRKLENEGLTPKGPLQKSRDLLSTNGGEEIPDDSAARVSGMTIQCRGHSLR